MKTLKIFRNCLLGVIVIALLITLFISFVNKNEKIPKIGDYSLLVVEGTSMYPHIKDGDLIAIDRKRENNYEENDVVSFILDDGTIITHKIIKIENDGEKSRYYTKGINNNYQDNDYIEFSQIIGKYNGFRIPYLGYIIGFANTRIGYLLLVIIPLGIVLVIAIMELVKELSKKRGEY